MYKDLADPVSFFNHLQLDFSEDSTKECVSFQMYV